MTTEMAVVSAGPGVLELVGQASDRVVIVAPYLKVQAVRRVLAAVPNGVKECTCVTRWLPEDIAAGASDLEVWDEVRGRDGGRLWVHPHLHAKYYCNGFRSLVGSANLTGRGLGWRQPSNVELLVALPGDFPGLAEWERVLLSSAVEATEQLRDRLRGEAEALKERGDSQRPPEVEADGGEEVQSGQWVPGCPVPERLWEVYRGEGRDTMTTSAFEAAEADLRALAVPGGLTLGLFVVYVGSVLRHMPVVAGIDQLAESGLTDGRAEEFLERSLSRDLGKEEFEQVWRVIRAWLMYFFPETYMVETGQEVLVKGRKLPDR